MRNKDGRSRCAFCLFGPRHRLLQSEIIEELAAVVGRDGYERDLEDFLTHEALDAVDGTKHRGLSFVLILRIISLRVLRPVSVVYPPRCRLRVEVLNLPVFDLALNRTPIPA